MIEFGFQNKNIVLLIKSGVLGGAERQALGLANYLINKLNCKVFLVCTHSNITSVEFETFAKISGINNIHFFGYKLLNLF